MDTKRTIMACKNCVHRNYCDNSKNNANPEPTDCGVTGGIEIGYAFDHEGMKVK